MNPPIHPTHPLDHQAVVKIMLGEAASESLAAVGPHHLVLATEADATSGEAVRGRMVLLCLPISKEAADGAFRVATGKARAVKTKSKISRP